MSPSDPAAPEIQPPRPAPEWMWRLYRLLAFPDSQVTWLPFVVSASIRTHRAHPVHAVYSTSAPITSHLAAGIIKRLTGLPWVAEFRDPWLGSPVAAALGLRRPWLHRRLQVKLERWIVRSADRIVFVSPSTMRRYRARYPDAAEMVTITNGHDPSEAVVGSADPVGRDRYRIVWTGTLDRPDELQVFLEALAAVVLRRPELADRLQVEFFGDVADSCRAVARGFIDEGALGPIVSFRGFVPRHVALEAVAGADAALIMLGGEPGMGQYVPSKLFDYIGQDRQILGVLPPGDARDILEELGWGVVAEPDVADVERAIERLLASEPPAGRADPEGRYDRVALAARLATALDQASRAGRQASPLGIPA